MLSRLLLLLSMLALAFGVAPPASASIRLRHTVDEEHFADVLEAMETPLHAWARCLSRFGEYDATIDALQESMTATIDEQGWRDVERYSALEEAEIVRRWETQNNDVRNLVPPEVLAAEELDAQRLLDVMWAVARTRHQYQLRADQECEQLLTDVGDQLDWTADERDRAGRVLRRRFYVVDVLTTKRVPRDRRFLIDLRALLEFECSEEGLLADVADDLPPRLEPVLAAHDARLDGFILSKIAAAQRAPVRSDPSFQTLGRLFEGDDGFGRVSERLSREYAAAYDITDAVIQSVEGMLHDLEQPAVAQAWRHRMVLLMFPESYQERCADRVPAWLAARDDATAEQIDYATTRFEQYLRERTAVRTQDASNQVRVIRSILSSAQDPEHGAARARANSAIRLHRLTRGYVQDVCSVLTKDQVIALGLDIAWPAKGHAGFYGPPIPLNVLREYELYDDYYADTIDFALLEEAIESRRRSRSGDD